MFQETGMSFHKISTGSRNPGANSDNSHLLTTTSESATRRHPLLPSFSDFNTFSTSHPEFTYLLSTKSEQETDTSGFHFKRPKTTIETSPTFFQQFLSSTMQHQESNGSYPIISDIPQQALPTPPNPMSSNGMKTEMGAYHHNPSINVGMDSGSSHVDLTSFAPFGPMSGAFGSGRDTGVNGYGMHRDSLGGFPSGMSFSAIGGGGMGETKHESSLLGLGRDSGADSALPWGLSFVPPSVFPPLTGIDSGFDFDSSKHSMQQLLDGPIAPPIIGDSYSPEEDESNIGMPPGKKRRRTRKKQDDIFDDDFADGEGVRGSARTGYRMILEEPAHKDMLSCHQCKNKKKLHDVIICGHVFVAKKTMKTCTKKYCKSCLLRFYLESPTDNVDDTQWPLWKCPCCRYICCCAWCRKKKAKRLEHASASIRANAHRLSPATSLARKLVTETGYDEPPGTNPENPIDSSTAHLLPPHLPLPSEIGSSGLSTHDLLMQPIMKQEYDPIAFPTLL